MPRLGRVILELAGDGLQVRERLLMVVQLPEVALQDRARSVANAGQHLRARPRLLLLRLTRLRDG